MHCQTALLFDMGDVYLTLQLYICQSLFLLESQVYVNVRDSDRGNVGLERGLGYGTRIR